MPTNEELCEWMEAVAQAADRQAFAALFKHLAPRIKAYLMRGGTPPETAEELTQDVMVLVWRRAATFNPQVAGVTTWVFTIARNTRIDHFRRRSTAMDGRGEGLELSDIDQPSTDPGLDPEALAAATEQARHIQRALAQLPPEQVEVLRLSFFEDLPHSRIAQDLGMPLGTVKSRIRLAVGQLRRKLAEFGP